MITRILGLDTGTNSLAWAVVDRDAKGDYTLVRRGDVIFTEGVNVDGQPVPSKAAVKSKYKSLRVQYARRRLRKIDTLKVLVSLDLCPYLSDEQLSQWKAKKTYPLTDDFMLWQRSGSAEENNPYYCRYRCLTQKLDLTDQSQRFLLGRAFYHLAQRRGFLSNRLDTTADSVESGKVKSGIAQLSVEMEKAGCTFLGEYFYQLYKQHGNTVRLRSRYTDREEHYIKEFLAICEKQELDAQWVEKLQRALYFQRPLKSQRKGVGKCTFEPKKLRSVGGDSTQMNLTLCDAMFNRQVKGARLPSQLPNHTDILVRIDHWKSKCEDLRKQLDKIRTYGGMEKNMKDRLIQKRHRLKMDLDYWQGKYSRFTMTEVPEGFSRRQGAGIGLVSKYAGLFLKSLFHNEQNPNKSNVYVVKGVTTAEFRRMWGLQGEYEKKSRLNHCHHCIDAITIACIGKAEYDKMAQYYHDEELFQWRGTTTKPHFNKPWPTFTEDVLAIEQSLLVKHLTKDNMPKQAKKRVRTATGKYLAQGDTARGSLHKDTYYGAIEQDGEIRYVLRKPLNKFENEAELEKIVDQAVKEKIKEAIASKNFKTAITEPIFMNKEKGIRINKVRCYVKPSARLKVRQQRDLSSKEYKQYFYVENDINYMVAIYEGELNGKKEREFCVVNNLTAASYFKKSSHEKADSLVPERSPKNDLPLLYVLKRGVQVLLYENSPKEIQFDDPQDLVYRLYEIVGIGLDGNALMIDLRFHQEARRSSDLDRKKGAYKENETLRPCIRLRHTQFKALVDGVDFEFNILGEIKKKERHA